MNRCSPIHKVPISKDHLPPIPLTCLLDYSISTDFPLLKLLRNEAVNANGVLFVRALKGFGFMLLSGMEAEWYWGRAEHEDNNATLEGTRVNIRRLVVHPAGKVLGAFIYLQLFSSFLKRWESWIILMESGKSRQSSIEGQTKVRFRYHIIILAFCCWVWPLPKPILLCLLYTWLEFWI